MYLEHVVIIKNTDTLKRKENNKITQMSVWKNYKWPMLEWIKQYKSKILD